MLNTAKKWEITFIFDQFLLGANFVNSVFGGY
jgi:hypothetical protein